VAAPQFEEQFLLFMVVARLLCSCTQAWHFCDLQNKFRCHGNCDSMVTYSLQSRPHSRETANKGATKSNHFLFKKLFGDIYMYLSYRKYSFGERMTDRRTDVWHIVLLVWNFMQSYNTLILLYMISDWTECIMTWFSVTRDELRISNWSWVSSDNYDSFAEFCNYSTREILSAFTNRCLVAASSVFPNCRRL
jgi:hypothetical protein